jgi:hypothetical protein
LFEELSFSIDVHQMSFGQLSLGNSRCPGSYFLSREFDAFIAF